MYPTHQHHVSQVSTVASGISVLRFGIWIAHVLWPTKAGLSVQVVMLRLTAVLYMQAKSVTFQMHTWRHHAPVYSNR